MKKFGKIFGSGKKGEKKKSKKAEKEASAASSSTQPAAVTNVAKAEEDRHDGTSQQQVVAEGSDDSGEGELLHGVSPKSGNLGPSVLYAPDDAVLDVVFVHGLAGNAYDTWYDKKSETHWPTDFVKNDLPAARLIAYGYRADVGHFWGGAAQAKLTDHASNMNGYLVGLREDTDTEERKIIFVVHSLGGLVTERALQLSESNAEKHLTQIERNTLGIVFLGTPHTGSGLAPFATSVARALKRIGKGVNPDIVEILKHDSQLLAAVDDWFYQWLRRRKEQSSNDVHITCFWEELAYPVIGPVVTRESAEVKGYPVYSIVANHVDMTKFDKPGNPGYVAIRRELRRWTKPLLSSQQPQGDLQLDPDLQECLRSLDYQGLDSWQTRTAGPLNGTFQWILPKARQASQNNASSIAPRADSSTIQTSQSTAGAMFHQWLCQGEGIFWISGHAGTGKSTIMRYLADSEIVRQVVAETSPKVGVVNAVHFFYRHESSNLARSKEGLMRSLLYQILEHHPHLYDSVRNIWERANDRFLGQMLELEQERRVSSLKDTDLPARWSIPSLTQALKEVITQSETVKFTIFVDGLDEYGGTDLNLAELFLDLAKSAGSRVLLCLASRGHPDFKAAFSDFPQIRMEHENSEDLNLYVKERLKEVVADGGAEYRILPQMILENSQSVFRRAQETCDLVLYHWKRYENLDFLKEKIRSGSSLDKEHSAAQLCQDILDDLEPETAHEAVLIMLIVLQAIGEPLFTDDLAIILDNLKDTPTLLSEVLQWAADDDSDSLPSQISYDQRSGRSLSISSVSSGSSHQLPSQKSLRLNPKGGDIDATLSLDLPARSVERSMGTKNPNIDDSDTALPTFPRLAEESSRLKGRIEAICGSLVVIKPDGAVVPLYQSLQDHLKGSLISLSTQRLTSLYHGDQQLLKASLRSFFTIDASGVDMDLWEDIIGIRFLDYAFTNSHSHWNIAETMLKESQFHLVKEMMSDTMDLDNSAWDIFTSKGFKSNLFLDRFPPRNFLEYAAMSNLPHSFREIALRYNLTSSVAGPSSSASESASIGGRQSPGPFQSTKVSRFTKPGASAGNSLGRPGSGSVAVESYNASAGDDTNVNITDPNRLTSKRYSSPDLLPDSAHVDLAQAVPNAYDVNSDGGRLLYCAAKGGNKEIVAQVLRFGAKIHSGLPFALAALNCCIRYGNFDAAEQLVRAGADVNKSAILPEINHVDPHEHIPLVIAIWSSNPVKAVKFLVAQNANANVTINIIDNEFVTILVCALATLESDEALRTVQALFRSSKPRRPDPNIITAIGFPLTFAINRYNMDLRMVKLLLEHDADPNLRSTTPGSTPLEDVMLLPLSKNHRKELTSLLLEHGATVTKEALRRAQGLKHKVVVSLVQKAYERQSARAKGKDHLRVPDRDTFESSTAASSTDDSESDSE
ncbi:MAG: hypothetical protein M1820_008466 [Bogoriella megaspora]|nr:MAG: hypothetical protein M1820_008466 [Bogoriella megaspora]